MLLSKNLVLSNKEKILIALYRNEHLDRNELTHARQLVHGLNRNLEERTL